MTKNKNLKTRLHPRNKNREQYDLTALTNAFPELKKYVKPNILGKDSIDFSNPKAVKLLNKALLYHYYGIKNWEFPDNNLCPAIPGRADYLHHIADLLASNNNNNIPKGNHVACFDIGVGASAIYPIIGITEYGWNFIASDIDLKSINAAKNIVNVNNPLHNKVSFRHQINPRKIFEGIIDLNEKIDVAICNPLFHTSVEEAIKGTKRKLTNLTGTTEINPTLNFAGITNELVCEGGEYAFITNMIYESKKISKHCFWFTTLVSKESNLKGIYKLLKKIETVQFKTISMGTSNKSTRIVAWTFLTEEEQKRWMETRWK
jgi:23S rRNA (adenine1618-N6)-methyltransferase